MTGLLAYFATMKGVKIPHLITIAALCWLVLIGIQAKWIVDSRNLIEEQFDQKVSLALATAINSMDGDARLQCIPPRPEMVCRPLEDSAVVNSTQPLPYDDKALYAAVDEALGLYDIHMPYTLSVASSSVPQCNLESPYCCAITPIQPSAPTESTDEAVVNIAFPGKKAYLFQKMWWMLVASVFILLFVLIVFILAVRSVIHQKRISQWNIDFFNNMAHEFRTPLTNISLAVQRLVKRNPTLADDKYVRVVQKEESKLGAQIDRVLGIAELKHGGEYLQTEKLDLTVLLNQVIADMELPIQKTGATVTLHATSTPIIEGDRFHLFRAFKNLIDNSLKYTNEIPVVNIEVIQRGDAVVLTFADNGVGIASQDRELIFKRFHRIPSGNRHDQKGFGLGLSYVKMIIEDHKGTIRALKNAQHGSLFELVLPNTLNS